MAWRFHFPIRKYDFNQSKQIKPLDYFKASPSQLS